MLHNSLFIIKNPADKIMTMPSSFWLFAHDFLLKITIYEKVFNFYPEEECGRLCHINSNLYARCKSYIPDSVIFKENQLK